MKVNVTLVSADRLVFTISDPKSISEQACLGELHQAIEKGRRIDFETSRENDLPVVSVVLNG